MLKKIKSRIHQLISSLMRSRSDGRRWFTRKTEYKEFPLLLRYPEKQDENLKLTHSVLVTITHELEVVCDNGLPDRDYNDTLFDLDHDARSVFPDGIPIMVETFCGKRIYYIYTSSNTNVDEALSRLTATHSGAKLTWEQRPDADWNFIRRYDDEFMLYAEETDG